MTQAAPSDDRRFRYQRAIETAVDAIVEHWPDTLDPPREEGVTRRPPPASRPPVTVVALDTRDSAWRDLRSWAQLVMEERALTLGPRSPSGPDLALFLARHADWLSRHEAAGDCADELGRHARKIEDLALGHYTRKYQVGACPELTFSDDGVETGRCSGSLWALMRQGDDLLPKMVTCDLNPVHAWEPSRWPWLGRRLTGLSPRGVENLLNRLGGYRAG